MKPKMFLVVIMLAIVGGWVLPGPRVVRAGEVASASGYRVGEPIRHGNLTVFPVVASKSYPTGEFLTLDEGLRSGAPIGRSGGDGIWKCAGIDPAAPSWDYAGDSA